LWAKPREVDTVIAEIARANGEQNTGINQVLDAVTLMDQSTQSTAATAEESATGGEELSAQAISVDSITAQWYNSSPGKAPPLTSPNPPRFVRPPAFPNHVRVSSRH
jgi:methyl-accepting chemotaxis protein